MGRLSNKQPANWHSSPLSQVLWVLCQAQVQEIDWTAERREILRVWPRSEFGNIDYNCTEKVKREKETLSCSGSKQEVLFVFSHFSPAECNAVRCAEVTADNSATEDDNNIQSDNSKSDGEDVNVENDVTPHPGTFSTKQTFFSMFSSGFSRSFVR